MVFNNLPIEFDKAGQARMRAVGVADPFGLKLATRSQANGERDRVLRDADNNPHVYRLEVDPLTRASERLGVKALIDFEQRRVIDARVENTGYRGYEQILKDRSPSDAVALASRVSGQGSGANSIAAAQALEMAYGVTPPPLATIVRSLGAAAELVGSHVRHLFLVAGPDYSAAAIAQTNPSFWLVAQQTSAAGEAVHGFRTIGEIMTEMNLFSGHLYREALHLTRTAAEVAAFVFGKYPHPSSVFPGGVGIEANRSTFQSVLGRINQLVDYAKKIVAVWDDLIEFLYAADPRFQHVGETQSNFISSGLWDDPAVYEAIGRADTVGVFQIESRAQMSMLPRLKPKRFYDLVIEVAIVRPGPIQGGMVHPYLRRRTGQEPAISPHPCLDTILERTLGVPLFQEQVMQIAMVGAGYTPGEADQLRRDMAAWKKHGRLERHRERLLRGFSEKGISARFSEQLFAQIQGFGEYGFPESHAASFALIVYASAYLKVHHPAAFCCAILNSQPMGFYSPSSLVQDAQRHGVEVRPVCVTVSTWDHALEADGALRLGMRLIKGFGAGAAQAIEEARADAEFTGVADLVRRAGLHKNEVEALAEAGALEALVGNRREALWRARAPRVDGLFDALPLEPERDVGLPQLRAAEQLVLDYGRLGLSLQDHPMKHYRPRLDLQKTLTAEATKTVAHGTTVRIAGLVIGRQRPATASGVTFFTLEDETGVVNVIVRKTLFDENYAVARYSKIMAVVGRLEKQGPVIHVLAEKLERLDAPGKRGVGTKSRDFH